MSIHIHHLAQSDVVDDEAAMAQFRKQWDTYQKVVDHDALAHKEGGAILHDALKSLTKPFNFFDIACGDAGQMKRALSSTKIRHYHGIDLSEPALELAADNLDGAPFDIELDCCDFVEALKKRPEPTDVAWCSLSIHHLSTEGKQKLLDAICRSTADFFMLYEPTLADGEGHDAYMERFEAVNRPAWNFLSADEWTQIYDHVTACDLPETAETWLELGRRAGFSKATQVFLDPTRFYGLYRYDR